MQQYHIPTDKEEGRFLSHLQIHENKRILFSGPFGSGKTTFLVEFFKKYTEYTPILLRPINYSIASNKDIIEYIKVDILFELLSIMPIDNTQYKDQEIIPEFIAKGYYPFLVRFIELLPVVGKSIKQVSEVLEIYIKEYKKYKESKNETELTVIEEFIQEYINEKGGLFEEDKITSIIRQIIKRYKNEGKKQIVLIIDDLDRIDPEHIFRILNVFACNADASLYGKELDNKFVFDKIMVVCDVDNIRYLFAHKYGNSTDFCGYIDKFYSTSIYNFSLKNDIIKSLPQFIIEFNNTSYSTNSYERILIVRYIIKDLIIHDLVNLRSLHNLNAIKLYKHGYYYNREIFIDKAEAFFIIYQYIQAIYLTEDKINDVFSVLKSQLCNQKFADNNICLIAGYFCHAILYLSTGSYPKNEFTVEVGNNIYKCDISERGLPCLVSFNDVKIENITDFNLYHLVEEALIKCKHVIDYGDIYC